MTKKMKNQKEFFSALQLAGSILLLACSVLLVGYYILFPSRGYFHSDTTDTIMWAEASCDAGKLFNQDFSYACLLPFGTSLIMTALIPITGVSMTTHVLGMLIFFLIFTGSLILMLRQMGWNWGWISIAVFCELMTCSGSEKLREIFWGHTIYYSLGVCFLFIGLGLLFRQMNLKKQLEKAPEQQQKNLKIHFICCTAGMSIFFLLAGMNQISALTIFSLPVIGAVFCERWFDTKTKLLSVQNLHAVILIALMGVATVGGYLLTNMLSKGITADYAEAYSAYSDMRPMGRSSPVISDSVSFTDWCRSFQQRCHDEREKRDCFADDYHGGIDAAAAIDCLIFLESNRRGKVKNFIISLLVHDAVNYDGLCIRKAFRCKLETFTDCSHVSSCFYCISALGISAGRMAEISRFTIYSGHVGQCGSMQERILKMPADNTARSDFYMLSRRT